MVVIEGLGDIRIFEFDKGIAKETNDTRIFLLNFKINEDEKSNPTDLTLTPEKQGEAEFFCITFLDALNRGNAGFNPTDDGITFFNEECPFQPAQIDFQLDEDEQRKLREFFEVKKLAIKDMRPEKIGIQIFQHKEESPTAL